MLRVTVNGKPAFGGSGHSAYDDELSASAEELSSSCPNLFPSEDAAKEFIRQDTDFFITSLIDRELFFGYGWFSGVAIPIADELCGIMSKDPDGCAEAISIAVKSMAEGLGDMSREAVSMAAACGLGAAMDGGKYKAPRDKYLRCLGGVRLIERHCRSAMGLAMAAAEGKDESIWAKELIDELRLDSMI